MSSPLSAVTLPVTVGRVPAGGRPRGPAAVPELGGGGARRHRAGAQAEDRGQGAPGDEGRAGRRPSPAGAAARLRELGPGRRNRFVPSSARSCRVLLRSGATRRDAVPAPCAGRRVTTLHGRWDLGHNVAASTGAADGAALWWAARTKGVPMTHTAPVEDWATDFDVLDPRYVTDPFSIWDDLRQTLPDRAHRPAQEQLAADPLRRRHRHRARHRALQLAQGGGHPRRRGRGSRRASTGPTSSTACRPFRRTRRCTPGRAGSCCPGSRTSGSTATCR